MVIYIRTVRISMINWYDKIAGVYDSVSVRSYKKPRKALIEKMSLQRGETILLVGCGTGLIFQLIQNRIGDSGTIVGIDASKNMLLQAKRKINQHNWKNVHLIHADAIKLSNQFIAEHVGEKMLFDHIIGELSFSVMKDWQTIMERSMSLLKKRGKLGVLDGYRHKKDAINMLLNLLPRSDISREISSFAESITENYESQKFGFTKIIFIGVGRKPKA